jgi:hypothetical protein
MSGPKVVRIVTREELLDICRAHLARVDAALAEWIRIGKRNGCVSDAEIGAARQRRDELAALLAADRFTDIQKQAPQEEAFLRADVQARLAKLAAGQAAARSKERRARDAAATLLRTLRDAGVVVPEDIASGLAQGTGAALERGFILLAEVRNQPSSSEASDLAKRLKGDEAPRTLAVWLASQSDSTSDPAIERLDARIAELENLTDESVVYGWRQRLDEAVGADSTRRDLLLDGLEIETGRALTSARRRSAALFELEATLAELDTVIQGDSPRLRAGVEALSEDNIRARIAEANDMITRERAATSALARRAAVLEGLSALGYEVTEGMSTSWVEHGRVVLHSSSRPDYGVELSGNASGGRLQMRAVAFTHGGTGPDPIRDRDAETIWCSDVSGLQERLAKVGDGLVIERALPVGATPLKRVERTGVSNVAVTTVPAHQLRTLK